MLIVDVSCPLGPTRVHSLECVQTSHGSVEESRGLQQDLSSSDLVRRQWKGGILNGTGSLDTCCDTLLVEA